MYVFFGYDIIKVLKRRVICCSFKISDYCDPKKPWFFLKGYYYVCNTDEFGHNQEESQRRKPKKKPQRRKPKRKGQRLTAESKIGAVSEGGRRFYFLHIAFNK